MADSVAPMTGYDSINGRPACANDYILNQMMRQEWGAEHAFVSTDCGAVLNMMGLLEPHPGGTRQAATPEEAAAWSIMNGTVSAFRLLSGAVVMLSKSRSSQAEGSPVHAENVLIAGPRDGEHDLDELAGERGEARAGDGGCCDALAAP